MSTEKQPRTNLGAVETPGLTPLDRERRLRDTELPPITGLSAKTHRRQRLFGLGPRWQKINGGAVRYRLGDVLEWLDQQPAGGGERPR